MLRSNVSHKRLTFFSIPLVLISRFILDLRQVDQQNTAATTHVVGSSSLNFRMPAAHGVVGNMGESLVFAGDNPAWGDMEDVTDDDDARYWSEDALWEVRASQARYH